MQSKYRQDVVDILSEMLYGMPDVRLSKAFGYPAFKVGRRIFAFVGANGISVKLGAARVQELVDTNPAYKVFEVGEGVPWKGWMSIAYEDPEAYLQVMPLLQEAQENLTSE
ncbi:MAG: MmcQ/YjbR family DNA-binding protein [Anaerolineae bacterium]|nr:MmcQ/YjbR family DNA-binding protein [Anaerolineae bacterium]